MVNDVCLGVIHKVPAPGGMSAVGGTGSVYTFYDNAAFICPNKTTPLSFYIVSNQVRGAACCPLALLIKWRVYHFRE